MLKPLDPYGSHLPTLHAVVGLIKPKRVLEFGSGFHSTPFFLSVPGLERLVSVERDPDWRERMARECDDDRLKLTARSPKPAAFDLVFIDDGKEAAERVATILWVLRQPHPSVVIHDVEVAPYAAAVEQASEEPLTGVLW